MMAMAASMPAWISENAAAAQGPVLRNMGVAPTACSVQSKAAVRTNQPFDLVEHCHGLGVAGVETRLSAIDAESVRKFRQKLEAYEMRAVLNAPLPRDESGVAAFDAAVKACKEAGAYALHAAMTGRRYEDLNSLDAFKQSFQQNQKSVALAEPILRKHRMPLAIENHKGWRSGEQAAWLKRVGSEWVGVCFDFGNNLSLCEDPADTLKNLAPLTIFSHIKDMGVEQYEDGFLLSEVLFGQGVVNLRNMIDTLRTKDPNMLFCLEMITRDPLKIPVFTDKYWSTFDDTYSPLPGRDLARVLNIVRRNPPKNPLPRITGLSPEAQVKFEQENNIKCIAYAREHLAL
jgi:sugar phosphate isomerase/epimerase